MTGDPITDSNTTLQMDHDSPWKEALEHYFSDFLELLFPEIHAEIDWQQAPVFLDKELQQVVRDADGGRRYADKLIRVYSKEGAETWVLIHIEVQGEPEQGFAERMFHYFYRLRDRYGVDIASLAVLADTQPSFRPEGLRLQRWGCSNEFRFPTVKLLDYLEPTRWAALEQSCNRFSLVVMAQLRAKLTPDVDERKGWKFRLVRSLYERGYGRADILELFRIIDWMIRLPVALEEQFREDVYELEEEQKMPYVTTVELAGIEKGVQLGIQQGIQQGMQQGKERGLQEGRRLTALNLLHLGLLTDAQIAAATGLSLPEIEALRSEAPQERKTGPAGL